ncbi:LysR family transcriptional regulator [Kibdelosporangium persicum]|uniref:HTH-type transcriptional activator AllS n=1 Tax=Kibdelosporangium persicum TaxID=2698649 RepID=A0ABX2F3A9_9PSEU|nr:LysR family transcriptional regulator [Kibdelosporangium persicum]NRN65826.1 HTH-type transcriptional activator AllS [Kibdelosporangium persicum]
MLERTETEVLLALAEELHFGRTAERLRLTTSQVSRTVKSLERRIGAPLFARTSRAVALTSIGARLVEDLRPHVKGMDAAVRTAIEAGRGVSGTLRVAFVGAAAGQLLLKAVALFGSRYPDCEVHIHEAQVHDACERVYSGAVDVLITGLPVRGVRVGPVLLSEPQFLAVPRRHRLANRTKVTREVLADHPVVQMPDTLPEETRRYRIPDTTPSGRPVRHGPKANTFPEILTLVAAGQGVFPVGEHVTRFYPRPDITYIPMPDAPPLQWAPVWLDTNETGPVRAFVTCATEITASPASTKSA